MHLMGHQRLTEIFLIGVAASFSAYISLVIEDPVATRTVPGELEGQVKIS